MKGRKPTPTAIKKLNDAENLPTKYLRTYAAVEKMWGVKPWEKAK